MVFFIGNLKLTFITFFLSVIIRLMPRQKLSEFRAKKILYESLDLEYKGWSINALSPIESQLSDIPNDGRYVLKVDEGVKGRFKKDLVDLNIASADLPSAIQAMSAKGYDWLIIEPLINHEDDDERYLSLTTERSGLTFNYTPSGGVNVENESSSMQHVKIDAQTDWQKLESEAAIGQERLKSLVRAYQDNFFVFLEINPYVTTNNDLYLLDAAVEVDDAGEYFVNSWKAKDLRRHSEKGLTQAEKIVQELDANSPASLKLSLLEPNGAIFLLLSGGGASVLIADEIYNHGYGSQIGNYGEYSGNPNSEETYLYTKAILGLLIESSAPKKVLFIGGAVANFTDIAKTFAGIIKAIDEVASVLRSQDVKVYVRRGGPNQETGLARLKEVLEKNGLLGAVHDPSTPLTEAITEALEGVERV
jgi:ATP-citrate lyase beta-subunit